jgi:hypothetical protein
MVSVVGRHYCLGLARPLRLLQPTHQDERAMKLHHSVVAAAAIVAAVGASAAAAAETINLVYSGVAVANTRAAPQVQAFADWCNAATGACFPTVQQPAYDAATGRQRGTFHVWGAFPFQSGATFPGSLCFSEYIVFVLDEGELHVHSGPKGTCGAFIDPALKPPNYTELGATAVVAGGGDGVIAGGSGKYKGWSGSFTDRVFVGFGAPTSGVGGIVYYDQLLFRISGK